MDIHVHKKKWDSTFLFSYYTSNKIEYYSFEYNFRRIKI